MLKSTLRAAVLSTILLTVTAAVAADGPVVATVNGKAIHRSEVVKLHDKITAQNPQMPTMPLEQVMGQLVDRLVDERLVMAAARQAGTAQNPQVIEEIEYLKKQVIQNAYLRTVTQGRLTDEKLRTFYKDKIASAASGDEVHARHILVDSEDTAKAIIKKLDGGADFIKIAKSESKGPSGPKGGDLGYFTEKDMVPAFAKAAFKIKKGTYSKTPVKTEFGWHVIKVEDRRKAAPPAFEQVRKQIYSQVAKQEVANVLKDLHQKAQVEILFQNPPHKTPAHKINDAAAGK